MTTMVLAAEERTTLGKKVARLRRTGLIPATVYGKQVGPISIQIDAKAFDDIYRKHGRAVTIELQVAGHEPLTTTIHGTSVTRKTKGASGSTAPAAVAMPLPPEPRRKTEYWCPSTGMKATRAAGQGGSSRMAAHAGATPLSMSHTITMAPAAVPSSRRALPAPMLPVPIVLMSTW